MDDASIHLHEKLESRIRFETLIADLSAGFINLPADQVDAGIEDAQRLVCKCLNLDRSSFWQVSEHYPREMLLRHKQQFHEGLPSPKQLSANDLFPWTTQKILAGESVIITKMSNLPPEASRDVESYDLYGTKSAVVIPFSVGGERPFGCLTFAMMREERDWPETVVKGLHLITQVFANALARKRADEALQESESRLQFAADSAEAGLWILNFDRQAFWITEKTRELFGFPPDSEISVEGFLSMVHPDDREKIHHIIDRSQHSEEKIDVQYRIIRPDGSIRWFASRGSIHPDVHEETNRLMGVSIDITERKHSEMKLLESQQTLRAFTSKLLTIQEEERRRLARELHDDFTQRLAVLALDISTLAVSAKAENATLESQLHRLRDQIITLSTDIHDISRQLHPSIIDDLGLGRAIQSECTNFSRRSGISINYKQMDIPVAIDREISVVLFRVTQESLRNIHKHAQVKEAEVLLSDGMGQIVLTIQDDGVGFDSESTRQTPGLGLFSMEERVQLVHGIFTIESTPGHGTMIKVIVPLNKR